MTDRTSASGQSSDQFGGLSIHLNPDPEYVIIAKDGEELWKGTVEVYAGLLSMMQDDPQVEWRCWREDGSYGPPCTSPQARDEHTWSHRHHDCTRIIFWEVQDPDEVESG